ncbi:hypothetical protein BRD08_03985 [Halobacteriales archaeon SW_10_66_29]|nr:MAG: hypothetical protein BRD08_03985 [Halobacteriales archaeon SW_10_66_29]
MGVRGVVSAPTRRTFLRAVAGAAIASVPAADGVDRARATSDGDGQQPHETDSPGATDTGNLAQAGFEVQIAGTNTPEAGEELVVTVEVSNTYGYETTQTVSVEGLGTASTTLTLEEGASTTERFSLATTVEDAGQHTITATTGDDTDTATVTVVEPAGDGGGGLSRELLAFGGLGGLLALFGAYTVLRWTRGDGSSDEGETPTDPAASGSDGGAGDRRSDETDTSDGRGTASRGSGAERDRASTAQSGADGDVSGQVTQADTRPGTDPGRTGGVPTEVPAPPELSLSYDDITKQSRIGSGGQADVYRAEVWDKLDDHDHVVTVVDYGTDPRPWIVMEYMDAGHAGDCAGELPLDQALWTAIATTRAVRHAPRRGVAHLDLKPQNILFLSVEGAWDVPKVADWGLSKQLLQYSKSVEGMSPHYAAPEQFDGGYGTADDITDVYQLGAVLYVLFTGRLPFQGDPAQVMRQVLNEQPPPPSEVADVPPALDDVLLSAMSIEKGDRYESVLYLRDELQTLRDRL